MVLLSLKNLLKRLSIWSNFSTILTFIKSIDLHIFVEKRFAIAANYRVLAVTSVIINTHSIHHQIVIWNHPMATIIIIMNQYSTIIVCQ